MRKIKRFDPISVMRISALCYGVMGLLEGVLFGFIIALKALAAPGQKGPGPWLGILFLFLLPVVAAVAGAIGGGLGAVFYNVSARYVGGIQVEVE